MDEGFKTAPVIILDDFSKLAMPEFASDLPLILSGDALGRSDVKRAGDLVLQRLVARLKGDPWQGSGA